jgi:hypothetical protein
MSTETKRLSWRRTLGHAGVYLAVAGFCELLIMAYGLLGHWYTPSSYYLFIWTLIVGLLMLGLGLVAMYSSLVYLQEPRAANGLRGAIAAFREQARGISAAEMLIVTIPYWVSRISLLLALLWESGNYPDYGLFLLMPLSLYCIIRSLILHFVFRKRTYRNLIALPIDLIVAFLIIDVQF